MQKERERLEAEKANKDNSQLSTESVPIESAEPEAQKANDLNDNAVLPSASEADSQSNE